MDEQGVIFLAIGIALMGYFIGTGLKQMNHPKKSSMDYFLIEEQYMHTYINLSREEFQDLITKNPNAPKIQLSGKTFYNYHHFINWMSSPELYK